jgi:hypothetical protein
MATKNKNKDLFDPGSVLSGKALQRAASAATRLEHNPILQAHKRELLMIARQRGRDQRGLARLGQKTVRQMNQNHGTANKIMTAGIGNAIQTGNQLVNRTAENQQMVNNEAAALETSQLGDHLESLNSRNLEPGGGAADQALRDAVEARKARSIAQDSAFSTLAANTAAGMEGTARNMRDSSVKQQKQAIDAVRSAIMSRRMDSRAAYGDAQAEVRGSMRTARGLKGATFLKNLMQLRDTERGFINERAALMQDARANRMDNKLEYDKLDWEKDPNNPDNQDDGDGSGSGGSDGETPKRMTTPEWKQWIAAVNAERDGAKITPGFFGELLDDAEKNRDIEWTATERNQFLKKYKQWYNQQIQGR